MAAPRGTYTPRSGGFSGQTFGSYYQYQVARAQALGYRSYGEQRQVAQQTKRVIAQRPVLNTGFVEKALRTLFRQEQNQPRRGPIGKLSARDRGQVTDIFTEFVGQDMTDRRIGAPLDLYLQRLGRRDGTEPWPVGETP